MEKHIGFSEEQKEKMRKEAVLDYIETSEDLKQSKKKRIKRIICAVIIIIILIKIFFGTIEITNPLGYPSPKARYYNVKVNGKQIPINYTTKHSFPIIPYVVNINSYYRGFNYTNNPKDSYIVKTDNSTSYNVEISSYSCYAKKVQVECVRPDKEMKENNDEEYFKMEIERTTKPRKKVYSGELLNDFAPYVKEEGIYMIRIYAKHRFTTNTIEIEFVNTDRLTYN